jgi:hypothetical protein
LLLASQHFYLPSFRQSVTKCVHLPHLSFRLCAATTRFYPCNDVCTVIHQHVAATRLPSTNLAIGPISLYFPKPLQSKSLFTNSSLLGVREKDVHVPRANVLPVQGLLSTLGLLLVLQEDESVASRLTVRFVNNHILLRNSEVAEEIADLTHISRERKTAHLEAAELVLGGDEIAKTNVATGLTRLRVSGRVVSVLLILTVVRLLRGLLMVLLSLGAIIAAAFAAALATSEATALHVSLTVVRVLVVATTATSATATSSTATAVAFSVALVASAAAATEAVLELGDLVLLEGGVLLSSDLE